MRDFSIALWMALISFLAAPTVFLFLTLFNPSYMFKEVEPTKVVAEGTYECFQDAKKYAKGSYIKLNTSSKLYDSKGIGLFLPEGCVLKEKYVE